MYEVKEKSSPYVTLCHEGKQEELELQFHKFLGWEVNFGLAACR
jgi:hypothetical protein